MQYTISDVRPHPALPGCLSVTLNHPDPTGQYSTWKVSFDPKNGAVPPVAGTVIETELDKKASQTGSEYTGYATIHRLLLVSQCRQMVHNKSPRRYRLMSSLLRLQHQFQHDQFKHAIGMRLILKTNGIFKSAPSWTVNTKPSLRLYPQSLVTGKMSLRMMRQL